MRSAYVEAPATDALPAEPPPRQMTLPLTNAVAGVEPAETAAQGFPGVRAQRAVVAAAVPLASTGQAALVYVLPVDKERESRDGTGVALAKLAQDAAWFPLHTVLGSLRALPPRPPEIAVSFHGRLLLAGLEQFLAENHWQDRLPVLLWQLNAQDRIRAFVRNQNARPSGRRALPALVSSTVFQNPLYHSPLLLPPPGTDMRVCAGVCGCVCVFMRPSVCLPGCGVLLHACSSAFLLIFLCQLEHGRVHQCRVGHGSGGAAPRPAAIGAVCPD